MTAVDECGVSLTGDPVTDALVPLATELAAAVYLEDQESCALIRAEAEDILLVHNLDPADAGWALATVAAGMLPGGAPPSLLLAWRALPLHVRQGRRLPEHSAS
ncbi:hypothetical protein Psed_5754 [Pseudonocardia dioxanivorans CB1190]|uniref:Uncharacterized protein n=1 Tax=Pseudonocardia dioxanivorans (strain ATCC 55486 / DSM 44775 / JCM 13855 / CB1190) TaxID=675635 RepID=F4D193_PSEUX|nr:hypothetical protein [Pseudonocardia dioxanivorans]AEA27881.1 hypothetical protein Psed_5754 [Pseudonocardia dioxanivorans CB1190]